MFVGRESELAELERRWAGDRFEFGVVYGTRRIGKTTMLQEFIKGKKAFYFQARKADEKDNLSAFSREYRRFRGMDEHVRYESFSDAFESIASDASSGRMVLIIDEIAYLCQKNQSLLSLLQFFVDGVFRQARLMLILSGSNVSFMEEILNNRNDPLYQRATFQIHLEKMPFHEARAFVEDRSIEEQVQYLGLFGPHPYYLGMIDHSVSFQENVRQLLYSKYGTLLDAPEKIMPVGVSELSHWVSASARKLQKLSASRIIMWRNICHRSYRCRCSNDGNPSSETRKPTTMRWLTACFASGTGSSLTSET